MERDEKRVFEEIERVHLEMNRLFQSILPSGRGMPMANRKVWCPPTDVFETDTCGVVKVEIAGMDEDDFEISFANRVLTIAGERRHDPAEKLAYQQMEISYGRFKTDVYVPWPVAEDEIEAQYKDGFLLVTLPKAKRQRKRIPVVAEEAE